MAQMGKRGRAAREGIEVTNLYSLDDAHVRMLLDLSREHLRHAEGGE